MSKGTFGINTPHGWLQILQADFMRLNENPDDPNIAVDFLLPRTTSLNGRVTTNCGIIQ